MPHESVSFLVTDTVSAPYDGKVVSGSWSYHSTLVAYQQAGSPAWYIGWQPGVVAPNLTSATHLAAVAVPPKVQQVTDGSGQGLTTYGDPGLVTISGLLSQAAPVNQGGSPGLDVEIATAKGVAVPNSQATVINPNNIPTLATTIMPQAENAARAAVAMHKQSAMVAIQPSTGNILAIANNAGFNDFALTAGVAPGSTMKVITSTALFNSGALTPSSQVACPPTYKVQGITYHNDKNETLPAGTPFWNDFAQSCNNAFTQQWSHLTGQYSLAATAKTYYGLDQDWSIGIPGVLASYFNAPASASGSELAQEAFGEGQLTASPLAMASVVATVDTGAFKQPILLQGTKQVTATPLPATTDADMKQLMQAVVTSGTAAGLGLGSTVYAKTGTADIPGQQKPNSWLVAFDPSKNVAVACLVLNAGYGAQFAGPEVKAFLDGY
jgi:cell division protein FtsI/penicillin-binding protein 2